MTMLKHRAFLALTLLEILVIATFLALGRAGVRRAGAVDIPAKQRVARRLGLTDLALWTEARYTRHPSQADLFSPFQDVPSGLEHFPAGSVVATPPGLRAFERKPDPVTGRTAPCDD
jgi:hypothetical protein